MTYWHGKHVVVTGGAGFTGSHVVRNLIERRGVPSEMIRVPRREQYDLRVFADALEALDGADVVLHLASDTNGLGYTRTHQAQQFVNCTLLDLQVFEAARRAGARRVVAVSSVVAYPHDAPSPLREEDLLAGDPADSHLGYGLAKRNVVRLAELYARQYDLSTCVLLAANVYGPGDNFDPQSAHVIPSLIAKCQRDEELVVWGEGRELRDFLYVEDLAEATVTAAEREDVIGPLNIGPGREASIREVVRLVVETSKFRGPVHFDASKRGGQPRRSVSIERAGRLLGFAPQYDLREGVTRTVQWYEETTLARA